jgi:N-acetylneuraminate synthase
MKKYPEIKIKNRKISKDQPPYIIAEMSANHNGNINNALKIIELAKNAGADAIKIQSYTPDTITLNCNFEEFNITEGIWKGKSLYDLYKEAHMPWEWHQTLFDYAEKIGITIFSSPFDNTAVDLLEKLNTPAYKIASFEIVDLPLIKYVASTGKPMLISTGMAKLIEIEEAIETAREGGCKEIAILHCVSGYPSPASDYNLRTLADIVQRFEVVTGLSDHTIDNISAITSIAMGASIIEKHFTLDRRRGGPDDSFSIEPNELKELCKNTKIAWESLGEINYEIKSSEKDNLKFRRSLYFVKNMKKGESITYESIRSIRPGFGLEPKKLESLIGSKINQDVRIGTPVKMDLITKE